MAKSKGTHYVKNKELYAEICISLEQDKLTKTAELMLIKIANHASQKMRYKNPDDREDCISYAILDLLRYWRSFNPIYKNAFAYYTEIAKKGFAKGWNTLHPKKYKNTISLDGYNSMSNNTDGVYTV